MLYIREGDGNYIPAPEKRIFKEANKICNQRLKHKKGALITTAEVAKDVISWKIRHHQVEVFACQFLNSRHQCVGFEEICSGTINQNFVYPREVVKAAFRHHAAAVILAHNHPSGDPTPSDNDIELTRTLTNILKPLQIRVLDHLVVGTDVVSMSELGLIDHLENSKIPSSDVRMMVEFCEKHHELFQAFIETEQGSN